MRTEKHWHILSANSESVDTLARRLGVTPITARILINRGISDFDTARSFLHPELNDLHDPSLLPGLDRAAQRVRQAVEQKEPIVIYGDYDVDGISATAILLRCLALLGAPAQFYVPDRLEEGYGLNTAAVHKVAAEGARLLITVDCGISAVAEVALARELGMDVIITDHHEPGDEVPVGALLINPKLPGCPYPFRELSGAGLAFKLAWAIGKTFSAAQKVSPAFRELLIESLSLAALGTIADVVPLRDENRTLAHFGLQGLSTSEAAGIRALREEAGLAEDEIGAMEVAFRLAPRLNAAGRMSSAKQAVELLTTSSPERAREIAVNLGRENSRRQRLQQRMLAEAREMLDADGGTEGKWSIVLAREGWHAGVVGIVAGRLAEDYWRPTVLLTLEDDVAHGSARALAPMELFDALHECSDRLLAYGGHARAAGLRLRRQDVPRFKADFEQAAARRLSAKDLKPTIRIDAKVELREITRPLLDDINLLAPFGEGNAEPLLAGFNIALHAAPRRMGAGGAHLSFWAGQGGTAFRAVAFGMGDMADRLARSRKCSLAFVPRINRWRGRENIELDVRDIKIE